MPSTTTERQHAQAEELDLRPDAEILQCLLRAQKEALAALSGTLPQLAQAASLMVQAIEAGGRLIYAAAGSSGLMALSDAAELGGTFGIPGAQVAILMAGGLPAGASMPGDTEDDSDAAAHAAAEITNRDVVIALTASGSTPWPMTVARLARGRGARVICLANNADAPIFAFADVAICLPTPPEVIAGSTRLGAATAQKAALNLMSSLMGIRLGHVHDGMMVNLIADNDKLRDRAAQMVGRIAGVGEDRATACLAQAEGAVKPAVLLAAGAASLAQAHELLNETKGNLRAALVRL